MNNIKKNFIKLSFLFFMQILIAGSLLIQQAFGNKKDVDDFILYKNKATGSYIKPILQLAMGLTISSYDDPVLKQVGVDNGTGDVYQSRMTTQAMARFGFQGRVEKHFYFKSEFQRDPGTYGTGVWTGTVSMQGRENWLKYVNKGLSLSGGVILDPASVNYMSNHFMNFLGQDMHVKLPLVYGGINLGQGILAELNIGHYVKMLPLKLLYSFTAGNPLATSATYPFGGLITSLGTLNSGTTKTMIRGEPGTNAEVLVHSAAIMINTLATWKLIQASAYCEMQIFSADANKTNNTDKRLYGNNFRTGLDVAFWQNTFRFFGNYSFWKNDRYLSTSSGIDQSVKLNNDSDYRMHSYSLGIDINLHKVIDGGIGFSYTAVTFDSTFGSDVNVKVNEYIGIGATYTIHEKVSAGIRWSRLVTYSQVEKDGDFNKDDGRVDIDTLYVTITFVL